MKESAINLQWMKEGEYKAFHLIPTDRQRFEEAALATNPKRQDTFWVQEGW